MKHGRSLRISASIRRFGGKEVIEREIFVVIAPGENIEDLVHMSFGGAHQILSYSYTVEDIYVSEKYCFSVTSEFLKNLIKQ